MPGKAARGAAKRSKAKDQLKKDQMKTKMKMTALIEDFDLYPRCDVDSGHVAHIAQAIESGAELPPIIADSKSKRIVDGFHRRRAYLRVHGKDAEAEVILKTYKDEAEILLDAITLNASHGRNMTSYDRAHAITIALKMEIDPEQVATALNMTAEKVIQWRAERVNKIEGTRRLQPLKLPVRHMKGKTLTEAQAKVIEGLGGNHQIFLVNQLIALIETDMLDAEDDNLIERLKILHRLLEKQVLEPA